MRYIAIYGLEVPVSRLGFGCLQLGGHGWGKYSIDEASKALSLALEKGITFFDTAPIYGLGQSEEILGSIIRGRRNEIVLATKAGLRWEEKPRFRKWPDTSPGNIVAEFEASLRRLGTDYIDLYQIHWLDPGVPLEEALSAMLALKRDGKIRAIGLCNCPLAQLQEAVRYAPISSVQIPYNLVDRDCENGLLQFCQENGVAVIAYSPLARGLLTGKYESSQDLPPDDHRRRRGDAYFDESSMPRHRAVLGRVRELAARLGKTPSQVALQWVLSNPAVSVGIFGAKSPEQTLENLGAVEFEIAPDELAYLGGKKCA